ncbi:MAG: type II toxin-antitoxin system VapC family toxin [Phycisphaerales bacterium]|nr:type II toxin-antitoxin system VapC family toxin [Phycisphaerales bacterium]
MTPIFLDTSYLIALLRRKDALHERAKAWRRQMSGRLITTEYVLVEFLDAMSSIRLRAVALATANALDDAASVEIVPASPGLLQEAKAIYAHADKKWGLTDCASFCVMRARRLTDALTADRHFEQAGFHALLRNDAATQ